LSPFTPKVNRSCYCSLGWRCSSSRPPSRGFPREGGQAGRSRAYVNSPARKGEQRAPLLTFSSRNSYGKFPSSSTNITHRCAVAKKEARSFDVSGDVARNINCHPPNTEYIRIQRKGRGQSAQ